MTTLGNTLWYAIFATVGNTAVGLLLAIAVDNKLPGKVTVFFRSIYFFPSLIGLVFVAIIWQYFFQTDAGVINYYLGKVGIKAVLLIAGALVFRMLGVFVCLLGASLRGKEKAFVMMAYTPKATVQAAIGGIPLSLGFACGDMVLTVAVLAIVLTAPLGAFVIDLSYKKLLDKR